MDHQSQKPQDIKRIPFLHWQSLGRDIMYCFAMERLQVMLIGAIRNPKGKIELIPQGSSPGESLIEYDGLLEDQWDYLARAIKLSRDDSVIQSFCVHHVQLPPSIDLAKSLTGKKLTKLILHNNSLGQHGMAFVAEVIRGNPTLSHLGLIRNRLDDNLEAVTDFAEALREHPSSSNLVINLDDDQLGGKAEAFSIIIGACANAESITVKSKNLYSQSAIAISQFIAMNHSVKIMRFPINNFKVQDAILIGQALQSNRNMHSLTLQHGALCPLSECSKKALLKSLFDTTNMNSLVDSNHTCLITGISQDLICNLGHVNDTYDPFVNEKKKIISALLDAVMECSDFSLLDGVPTECMPDVLGLIQLDPRELRRPERIDKYSLSLIFEVLRGW
eukprot:CAMPEP_0172323486 /NCGR_PEP_ID=MMETSP1058-20130122/48851_1 /TAXON_ID=83371 /ORGANISM="Detonula confervacea, Strain CCMP 353" /LENGTH=389 /DNA_ID=CAMNT_0013039493 /DNA_START=51 /DNA_END=1217 /DNA_ORIENTATION=+